MRLESRAEKRERERERGREDPSKKSLSLFAQAAGGSRGRKFVLRGTEGGRPRLVPFSLSFGGAVITALIWRSI